jgi:hypothetical protein
MMDGRTRREIDKVVERTLKDAGLTEPPVKVGDLLQYLEVHRDFYDLEDPNLLQRFFHRVRVGKQKLIKIVDKVKLHAVWLPDEEMILVDESLPNPKIEWASFHDATHRVLEWHRAFFLGDTAQTLDPDFQVADSVVVVFSLDKGDGDVRLVVKNIVGTLGLAAGYQSAANDDPAFGERDLLSNLRQDVPACLFDSRRDELGADVAFAEVFLVL